MALDYLYPWSVSTTCSVVSLTQSIATSVDVERLFSQGRILLPHLWNGLSAQSVRALLCLGDRVRLDLVQDDDVQHVTAEAEVKDDNDNEMEEFPVVDVSIL